MTTRHSIERAKERYGYNPKTAEHFMRNAAERGKTVDDFRPGRERSWIERHNANGCQVRIYNNSCFLLNERGNCVTLYPLPAWFGKRKVYDGKECVRNAVKYNKLNVCHTELSQSWI